MGLLTTRPMRRTQRDLKWAYQMRHSASVGQHHGLFSTREHYKKKRTQRELAAAYVERNPGRAIMLGRSRHGLFSRRRHGVERWKARVSMSHVHVYRYVGRAFTPFGFNIYQYRCIDDNAEFYTMGGRDGPDIFNAVLPEGA